MPLDIAFAFEAFAPFPFMLLGMFLFLRRHAGRAGSLFGLCFILFRPTISITAITSTSLSSWRTCPVAAVAAGTPGSGDGTGALARLRGSGAADGLAGAPGPAAGPVLVAAGRGPLRPLPGRGRAQPLRAALAWGVGKRWDC